ncbi:MAG TPA: hypothetical protein VF318_05655 [Dehalococcoidales bacterium]|jgi:hypothetical protein
MLCTEEVIQEVWEKGVITTNNDPRIWRQDDCGAWIARSGYGRQESPFSWEINYIHSQTQKGGHHLSNLRPMQWQNNIHKQDGDLVCLFKAVGVKNCNIVPAAPLTATGKN